jgi:hypothetical protein
MAAVCGMTCEICELKPECKGCPSGIDPGAKDRLDELKKLLGFPCPILKCAIENKVDYCLRCDNFPCKIHYKFNYPYSDFLLDSWKAMKEHRKDFGSAEFQKEMLRIAMKYRKPGK